MGRIHLKEVVDKHSTSEGNSSSGLIKDMDEH